MTIIYEYGEIPSNLKEKLTSNQYFDSNIRKYFSESWGQIKAKQFCGSINIGDETISIIPKIERNDCLEEKSKNFRYLIYMIQYVYDFNIDETESKPAQFFYNNILELFITKFQKELFKQIQMGLYKDYITVEDNLNKLKGKYLVNQNLKFNFLETKIFCEFDEFSEDNYLNQVFSFTINFLRNYSKNKENKKRLSELHLVFGDIETNLFNPNKIKELYQFNRLNIRFKKAYDLAIFLIKKLMIDFSESKNNFISFIFDMNILFEGFIGKLIKEIYDDKNSLNVNLQSKKTFGDFNLRPDILIKKDNQPILIVDTKYKIIENAGINTCDLYQVYSYGMAYPDWYNNNKDEILRKVMLLYPKHLEHQNTINLKPLGNKYNETKVNLIIRHIELNKNTSNFIVYLSEMKNEIKNIFDSLILE